MGAGEHRSGLGSVRDRLLEWSASSIERLALPLDRRLARRTRQLDRIPGFRHRRGGKRSYAEWAWLIGLLQPLIEDLVVGTERPRIVDVGCGTGLALIAAEPSVLDGGELIGLDVRSDDIEFCRRHYPSPPYRFETVAGGHPVYAPDAMGSDAAGWPIEDGSVDLLTAVSVLTHLRAAEARALVGRIGRVLRPGAAALVTVFLVDHHPDPATPVERGSTTPATTSRFHRTDPERWRFEVAVDEGWWSPRWAQPPERAIGLTSDALAGLAAEAGLAVERVWPGTWRERPGRYFQDLVVLRRPGPAS